MKAFSRNCPSQSVRPFSQQLSTVSPNCRRRIYKSRGGFFFCMSRTKRGVVTRKELCWGANTRIRRKTNDRTIFSPSTPLSRSTALRVRLISIISQKKTIQRRERQFFFLCAQRAKREQEQWFLIEKYPTTRRKKKGEPSSAAD